MSQPVDPNHANEEDLTAFALRPQAVEEAVAQHITRCEVCTRTVNEIVSLQRALQRRLSRFDCPSADRLVDYALHELPLREYGEVREHLRSCSRCTEEVQVTQEACNLFPSPSLWQTVRRVAASLALAPLHPGLEGMREIGDEGAMSQAFQRFVVGDVTVELIRSEEQGKILLTGRIKQAQKESSTPLLTPLAVRLLRVTPDQPPEPIDEIPPGPNDFFELAPVAPGVYQLEVLFSDRLIEIGVLNL